MFEQVTPIISNHIHVRHNFVTLLVTNWSMGKAHVSSMVLAAVVLLFGLALRSPLRRAAVWSLIVITTIMVPMYGIFFIRPPRSSSIRVWVWS